MPLVFGDNISYQGKKPLDARFLFSTLEAMKNYSENYLPPLAFCQNEEDGKFYTYNVSNPVDPTTGKWRKMESGSSGSGGGYGIFSFEVDDDGNLYVVAADDISSAFEYDPETGDLYYNTD